MELSVALRLPAVYAVRMAEIIRRTLTITETWTFVGSHEDDSSFLTVTGVQTRRAPEEKTDEALPPALVAPGSGDPSAVEPVAPSPMPAAAPDPQPGGAQGRSTGSKRKRARGRRNRSDP